MAAEEAEKSARELEVAFHFHSALRFGCSMTRHVQACRTRIAELKAENESLRAVCGLLTILSIIAFFTDCVPLFAQELTSAKALLNDPATRDAVGRLTKSLEVRVCILARPYPLSV